MNTSFLSHRGYTGSIEISVDDRCLYGQILFISDLVNYEGNTIDELEAAFIESVEDYIEVCKTQGKEPDAPFKGSFNVRIGQELHQRAAIAAKRAGLSLNEFVKQSISNALSLNTELVSVNQAPLYATTGIAVDASNLLTVMTKFQDAKHRQTLPGIYYLGTTLSTDQLLVQSVAPAVEESMENDLSSMLDRPGHRYPN